MERYHGYIPSEDNSGSGAMPEYTFPVPGTSFPPAESMDIPTPSTDNTIPIAVQSVIGDFQLYDEWQDFPPAESMDIPTTSTYNTIWGLRCRA